MSELETVEKPVEQPKVSSETETGKEVSQETKAPPLKETEEFKEALKKEQSGWDRRLQTQEAEAKAESKRLEGIADSYKAEVELLDKTNLSYLQDSPEAIEAYADKKAIAREKIIATRDRADAEAIRTEARKEQGFAELAKTAREISKDIGIPFDDLKDCETKAEMRTAAKTFQLEKKITELEGKTEDGKTFTPDSAVSTGVGARLQDLSSDEKIRRGTREMKI